MSGAEGPGAACLSGAGGQCGTEAAWMGGSQSCSAPSSRMTPGNIKAKAESEKETEKHNPQHN